MGHRSRSRWIPGALAGSLVLVGLLANPASSGPAVGAIERAAPAQVSEDVLFERDTYGYQCFRIPAIVEAADGTLLAFAEGRKHANHTNAFCNDQAPIDLVVRRLPAGSDTWSEPIVVAAGVAEDATRGNPAPVVVPTGEHAGRVVVLTTHNPAGQSTPRTPYVQYSDDHGQTWSKPVSLEEQIDDPSWGWYATGPVHAIALSRGEHAGRLVSGVNFQAPDGHYGGLVYSDDAGATWQLGARALGDPTDIVPQEISVVELVGGRVLAMARQQNRDYPATRVSAMSTDAGETFTTDFRPVAGLTTTPAVQGATLRLAAADQGDRRNHLLFSAPVHENLRKNMTIFSSFDEGRNWTTSLLVTDSRAGYSDMVLQRDGRIGLLYEGGSYPDGDARDEIRYATFTAADLE